MTVLELSKKLNLEVIAGADGLDRVVDGCYIGDLLSVVMGSAKMDNMWITVMGNINAIAVATLTDTACIVLAENSPLDDNAKAKADSQEVAVLRSKKTIYEIAIDFYNLFSKS